MLLEESKEGRWGSRIYAAETIWTCFLADRVIAAQIKAWMLRSRGIPDEERARKPKDRVILHG